MVYIRERPWINKQNKGFGGRVNIFWHSNDGSLSLSVCPYAENIYYQVTKDLGWLWCVKTGYTIDKRNQVGGADNVEGHKLGESVRPWEISVVSSFTLLNNCMVKIKVSEGYFTETYLSTEIQQTFDAVPLEEARHVRIQLW